MKVTVLGIQLQDYTSRRTGNQVKGVSLHVCHPDARVDGQAVESIFISDRLPCYRSMMTMSPGWVVNVEFDSRGSVVDAEALEPAAQYVGSVPGPGAGAGPQSGGAKK